MRPEGAAWSIRVQTWELPGSVSVCGGLALTCSLYVARNVPQLLFLPCFPDFSLLQNWKLPAQVLHSAWGCVCVASRVFAGCIGVPLDGVSPSGQAPGLPLPVGSSPPGPFTPHHKICLGQSLRCLQRLHRLGSGRKTFADHPLYVCHSLFQAFLRLCSSNCITATMWTLTMCTVEGLNCKPKV